MRVDLRPHFENPLNVVSVYFAGYGLWQHPLLAERIVERNQLEAHLKRLRFQPDVIYEATLTRFQLSAIEPSLLAFGFKHVHTSRNPNSGNIIYTYVRSPLPID